MRLINTDTLKLEEFVGNKIPDYAILSHTWGSSEEEVTFNDFNSKIRKKKVGFEKILKTCEKAKAEGISYAWVDTCSIDKSSSAELSEAINSMFMWYKNSTVCYAFLSDYDSTVRGSKMASSRWFSRGWTLQELIAPQIVHFFDKNWRPIGNKKSLRKELSAITGIETIVFIDPSQMDTYSIATRMSWASDRTTTRTEDIAYSLLGIFKVNMPLLYGEGSEAFIRLQEEIVKKNHDESIFAWGLFEETSLTHDLNLMWDLSGENIVVPQGPSSLDNSLSSPKIILPCGMFAVSPQAFSTCRSTRGFLRQEPVNSSKGATLTNRGLEIQLPVIEILNDSYGRLLCIGLLNCAFERSTDFVGILFLLHDGICNRSQRDLYATFPVSPAIAMSADPQDLIISNEFSEKPVPSIHISYAYVIFKINTKFSYQIASIHPARNKDIQWDDKNQVLGFRLHVKDTICFRFSEVFHKTMEFYLAIQTEDSGECLFYLSPKAEPRFDIILGSNRQLGSEHKLTLTDPGSGELVRVGLDVQSKTVLHRQMYRLTLSITGIATETKTPNQ